MQASLTLLCLATLVLGACASQDADGSPGTYVLAAGSGTVEIRRTAFGVPHVRAEDEFGLAFGLGYAYAADNLCLLAEANLTHRGERSKHFGPDAEFDPMDASKIQMLYSNFPLPPARKNLESDFYFKYLNADDKVQASWARQPQVIKDLITGYVAGFNRYLTSDRPARDGHACAGKPWLRELEPQDLVRFMRRFAVEQGGAATTGALFAAQPPDSLLARGGGGGGGGLSTLPQPSAAAPTLGSNGVALGREATQSGKGLLLANPHFPWAHEFRFYQAHLTIPGKLDAMGVTIGGAPLIAIGWNHALAWTHTVNSSRHFTLFALQLDPLDPTRYLVDGRSQPMQKQTLAVELPHGTATHDYYFTQYGPIFVQAGTFDWTRQQAFAFGDANLDNDRLFEQWWALDNASSLNEFQQAIERIQGSPWFHALAVDRAGETYYSDITAVPNVSSEKVASCVPLLYQLYAQQGLAVLSGDRSECDWDRDPAAPRPGLFPAAQLPSLRRFDYVQNSNESAWLTNPAARLTGYPTIVSTEGTPIAGRTRYGLSMIEARLAGRDGLPGNKFDLGSLQQLAFSNRSPYAPALLDDLRAACGRGGSVLLDDLSSVDLGPACQVLAGWDGRAELQSVGYPLFQLWRHNMDMSGLDYWTVPFDAGDPVHTPSGLRIADPLVLLTARKLLGQAHADLAARGVDYRKPWGEIQVSVRGNRRIPIHGGESDDVYNVAQGTPLGNGQLDVVLGSSAIWTVSFEGETPIAQGLLTYSQSSNPASAHSADQTERFSAKQWITFPFSDAEIAADPELTVEELQP